jgi:hypothetical protein
VSCPNLVTEIALAMSLQFLLLQKWKALPKLLMGGDDHATELLNTVKSVVHGTGTATGAQGNLRHLWGVVQAFECPR